MTKMHCLKIECAAPSAPPLLMLHGWGRDGASLKPLGELLAQGRTVLIPDLPGFGRSPRLKEGYESVDYAAALQELLREESLETVDLFGYSFGAKIAAQLCKMEPLRVRRVIFCAGAGLPIKRDWKANLRMRAIRLLGKCARGVERFSGYPLWERFFVPRYGSADYRSASVEMRQVLVATLREDLTQLLPTLGQPSLLIWGADDTATPAEMGRRWARLMRRARIEVLPQRGHDLFAELGAHQAARLCLPFLQEVRDA